MRRDTSSSVRSPEATIPSAKEAQVDTISSEVRVPAAVCWDTTQMRASRGNTGRARAQLSRAASRAKTTEARGLDSAGTCTTRWSVAVRCSGGRSGGNMAP